MAACERIARIGQPTRIWAIPSIHGALPLLKEAHAHIEDHFTANDRIVYLGNMIGRGGDTLGTIDELLRFRRGIIARRQVLHTDVVYLRGAQEEIWHRLLQLQFAPNPFDVLSWMLAHGAEPVVKAYGGDTRAGINAARSGARAITRWTNDLRHSIRQSPGHTPFFSAIRRAAITAYQQAGDVNTLLVSAGVCPVTPLAEQGETLWFGGRGFNTITEAAHGCGRIVRGRDFKTSFPVPTIDAGPVVATLDGGCGFANGILNLGLIMPDGTLEVVGRWTMPAEKPARMPLALPA